MSADFSPGRVAAEGPSGQAPFQAQVELLRLFLEHRKEIVEGIEALLRSLRTPNRDLEGPARLSEQFEDCFFHHAAVSPSHARLRGQLEEAYWADGFKPRPVQHLHNDLVHPVEMMMRGVHCWHQTWWPGRGERVHYAHTLFNLYVLRCLELLSLRLWDEDPGSAAARLAEIQAVLDELWRSSAAGQPAFVRDARWLIPLAQSLITDELAPYLLVARRVVETLPKADVLEIQKAHVRMLGGHLVSQIRHYCMRDGVAVDAQHVVVGTRTANALDLALLVYGLVGLLRAYDDALQCGDERMRIDMAGAICQGISPDPELFLSRFGLLSAYTMMEHVLISTDREGNVEYSPLGSRHVHLLNEYRALIERMAKPLLEDCPRFRPMEGGCSPFGVMFGLPTSLIEHMALKALQRDAETRFSLEDVFRDGDPGGPKLAWVNGWRKLPHIDPEIQRMFEYPQQFAEDVYNRIERELSLCAAGEKPKTGRLHIVSGADAATDSAIPELPDRYFVSSDSQSVASQKAELCERAQLLAWRQEGHFLASYETAGGWVALKKDLLTEVLGAGQDARVAGLPIDAAQVLRLMCSHLLTPENAAGLAS